jgi:hypothetical protein
MSFAPLHRALRSLLLLLLAVGLTACASTLSNLSVPSTSATQQLALGDLSDGFGVFAGEPRYDALVGGVGYMQIGKENYDGLFYNSALLVAQLRQLRFVVDGFEAGRFRPDDAGDLAYLRSMTRFGLLSLPDIPTTASNLLSDLASLNPTSDFGLTDAMKVEGTLRGLNETRKNLQTVGTEAKGLLGSLRAMAPEVGVELSDLAPSD